MSTYGPHDRFPRGSRKKAKKKKAKATTRKAPHGATHMLEDMVTSEVSLVTAAANNRRYLYTKSAPMVVPSEEFRARALSALLSHVADCARLCDMLKASAVDDRAKVDRAIAAALRACVRSCEQAASVARAA